MHQRLQNLAHLGKSSLEGLEPQGLLKLTSKEPHHNCNSRQAHCIPHSTLVGTAGSEPPHHRAESAPSSQRIPAAHCSSVVVAQVGMGVSAGDLQ